MSIKTIIDKRNIIIIAMAIGCGAIIAGIIASLIHDNPTFNIISISLLTFGGAAFGSAVSSIISEYATRKLEDEIKGIVQEGYDKHLDLDEELIRNYRKTLYLYHVTNIPTSERNPNFVWRVTRLNFASSMAFGKLYIPEVKVIIENDQENASVSLHSYCYNGYIKQDRRRLLICTTSLTAQEPIGIYIFPEFGAGHGKARPGIVTIQTYGYTNAVSPCIISYNPLNKNDDQIEPNTNVGVCETDYEKLEIMWKREFKQLHFDILPRINHWANPISPSKSEQEDSMGEKAG